MPKVCDEYRGTSSSSAIVLPAMEKAQTRYSIKFVNNEVLNCMSTRMDNHEAKRVIGREKVIEKYPRALIGC